MKKLNQALVVTGGIILILLGLFHVSFFWIPEWETELSKANPEMNSLVQMLNLGVVSLLLLLGIILLWFRTEVLTTSLGKGLLLTVALFLLVRLIGDFVFPGGSGMMKVILFLCVVIYVIPALQYRKKNN
jgi:nitrate reductase gamma subunit